MSNKRLVFKNTIILYIRMIVTLIISLYTSRITLDILGVTDFGIFNAVAGVVTLIAFLNQSFIITFQRFLCIEIARNNQSKIHKIIGASIIVQLVLCLIILLLSETIGLWFLRYKLVIPDNRLFAAQIIFQFSILISIVNVWRSIYNSLIISYEEMTLYAYLCIFEVIGKLVVVFMLDLFKYDALILYSVFLFGINVLVTMAYYACCKLHCADFKTDYQGIKPIIKEMRTFIGLSTMGSFSHVAKNQGFNFLLNIYGGPVLNAARAVSLQVYTAVYSFVSNFQMAFSPYQLKNYETENQEDTQNNLFELSRISFYIMFFFMIPIMFATNMILKIWLGENVPEHSAFFIRMVLLMGLFEAISNPLVNNILASGRIMWLQIFITMSNLIILGISYFALSRGVNAIYLYYFDFCSVLICFSIRVGIALKYTHIHLLNYIKSVILPIVLVGLLAIVLFIPILLTTVNIWLIIFLFELLLCSLVVRLEPKLLWMIRSKFKQ